MEESERQKSSQQQEIQQRSTATQQEQQQTQNIQSTQLSNPNEQPEVVYSVGPFCLRRPGRGPPTSIGYKIF